MVAGLLALLPIVTVQSAVCAEAELSVLLRVQEQIARGDEAAAQDMLNAPGEPCAMWRLARLALHGWTEARQLAPAGGAVALQGAVRQTLDELRAMGAETPWTLEREFAETGIAAAIAAAQDERPEMELLLAHARDLSERLALRNRRAAWPRSYNVMAGELWFEVDRYADAAAAYERAVRADASPLALVGLARALARLERLDEACVAYRRAGDAAPALREAAAKDLARCP